MEETAELVYLTFDLNIRSGILLEERVVLVDLKLQLIQLVLIFLYGLLLFQDLQELAGSKIRLH